MSVPGAARFIGEQRGTRSAFLALVAWAGVCAPPALAQPPAAKQSCTLHVTGAKPRPFKPSIFVKVKGPLPNPDDPSTAAYQYNPVTRALALTDDELRTLFPATTELEIVRHPEGMTKAGLSAAQGAIFPRRNGCHAELILSDVVAVFPSTARGRNPYGMVGSVLAGGDRIEIIFTFRRFDPGRDRPVKIAHREDGHLDYPGPALSSAALADAVSKATSKAFADFAESVGAQRGTR
jgi:hypothetical protein